MTYINKISIFNLFNNFLFEYMKYFKHKWKNKIFCQMI